MNIEEMNISDIEERRSAIALEMEHHEDIDLDRLHSLKDEMIALNERKLALEKEVEERNAIVEKVVAMSTENEEIRSLEEKEKLVDEVKKMSNIEVRKSNEYALAFVKGVKANDYTECRALLTEAVEGSIPVPTALENEIKNAWTECGLLKLSKNSAFVGDVKVSFEMSATGAVLHIEGTDAPAEETLEMGIVTIHNDYLKKWITVSDSAIENVTIDTVDYIFREIAQRIAEAGEAQLVGKIIAAPAVSTATEAGVPVYKASTIGVDTIVNAIGELSGRAKNVVLAMNRRTRAAFLAAAKNGKFATDPFDGCTVVVTDALKAFTDAASDETYVIVGDFGYGTQTNTPHGNGAKLIIDDKSMAEKDLVKIVGKQLFGCAVVAPNALVKIVK